MQVEDIRTVMIDGETWYVGRDVAKFLGYKSPSSIIEEHVNDTDRKLYKILINNKKHNTIIINRHGLEMLVSNSITPHALDIAKRFNIVIDKEKSKQITAEGIRIVIINGEKWYVGKDVASALGYKNPSTPIVLNVNNKYKKKYKIAATNRGKHNIIIINKHGLEELIFRSSMPNTISVAKKLGIKVKDKRKQLMKVENIRTVMIDGEKWYVGVDVGRVLGYKKRKTISTITSRYVNNKDKTSSTLTNKNGGQHLIIINKNGLKSLLSRSSKPNAQIIAKKFNIKVNRKTKKPTSVEGIRIVMLDGEKWFVARDVAMALGYKGTANYVGRNVDDKDKKPYKISTITGKHNTTIINKHGLEHLVSSSQNPCAKIIAKKFGLNINYMSNTYKGGNIRNITIDGKQWFVAKDVATILGYKNTQAAIHENVSKENKMIWVIKGINCNRKMILINKYGLEQLISNSTLPNALDVAKKLNINVDHILNTRKEQDSIHAILKTFCGERMVIQYVVGTYRIDLYFPKYKLAIECDELGHKYRNKEYERTRQRYIEDKLGCKFIRYNPDSKDYNIFDVINRIYKEIR